MTDNSSHKNSVLDSFLKPRNKEKKPHFGLYLDQEINDAVELAEKISSVSDQSESEISKESKSVYTAKEDTVVKNKEKKEDNKKSKKRIRRKIVDRSNYFLTHNQYIILTYLYNLKSRVTRIPDIVKHTNIPYGTIRGCIRTLVELKCINKPNYLRKGAFRGFSYTVNEARCKEFLQRPINRPGSDQPDEEGDPPDGHHINDAAEPLKAEGDPQANDPDRHTNKNIVDAIAHVLATHPELGYWRQKKLTPQQIQNWMELTGASLESMIQSLCHCRFEMVEMELEKEKDIQNVFNWFYRIIERAGFYPKPKGYKSYLERQLEVEKKLLAEKQEHLKAIAEVQKQKREAERNLAFYEMLSQPDSDLYQQCFSRLNKFSQTTKNTSLFEQFMRDAFDQIMDEQEQQLLAQSRIREQEDMK